MEIEYSQEVRKAYAYRFEPWELKSIAKSLKSEIKSREKKIDRIENDPKNEGQCTYADQIRELRYEIESLKKIINEFNG